MIEFKVEIEINIKINRSQKSKTKVKIKFKLTVITLLNAPEYAEFVHLCLAGEKKKD